MSRFREGFPKRGKEKGREGYGEDEIVLFVLFVCVCFLFCCFVCLFVVVLFDELMS
jgi:hypothetical protein